MYPADSRVDRERALHYTEQMIHQTVAPWLSHVIHRLPRTVQRLVVSRVEAFYGQSRPVQCPVKTLSQVMDECQIEQIDLLKIDAERAELDILRGIERRHWPVIRQLILEVHYPHGPRYDELVQLLQSQGFDIATQHNPTNQDSQMFYLKRRARQEPR
jgi:hypothetical protein